MTNFGQIGSFLTEFLEGMLKKDYLDGNTGPIVRIQSSQCGAWHQRNCVHKILATYAILVK